MKELNGAELVGYIKKRQESIVKELKKEGKFLKLAIIRDNNNPVIEKYVNLKKRYGEDIGIEVLDLTVKPEELEKTIEQYNNDKTVNGIIIQLPITKKEKTDEITSKIVVEKDVDNLTGKSTFSSATALAINWLLAGYDINLKNSKIAIVGQGKLVGKPLLSMWQKSGYNVTPFHRGDLLINLKEYDIIVSATGSPRLILSKYIKPGAVVVDAGTTSENDVIIGDVEEKVRNRNDLKAITPKIGGVGPLTVGALFDNLLNTLNRH